MADLHAADVPTDKLLPTLRPLLIAWTRHRRDQSPERKRRVIRVIDATLAAVNPSLTLGALIGLPCGADGRGSQRSQSSA